MRISVPKFRTLISKIWNSLVQNHDTKIYIYLYTKQLTNMIF